MKQDSLCHTHLNSICRSSTPVGHPQQCSTELRERLAQRRQLGPSCDHKLDLTSSHHRRHRKHKSLAAAAAAAREEENESAAARFKAGRCAGPASTHVCRDNMPFSACLSPASPILLMPQASLSEQTGNSQTLRACLPALLYNTPSPTHTHG